MMKIKSSFSLKQNISLNFNLILQLYKSEVKTCIQLNHSNPAKGIKIIMKAGFERLLAIACVKNLNQSVMVYFYEL